MTDFSRRNALGLIGGAATVPMLGTSAHADTKVPVYANTKINVGALRFTSHAPSFVAYERGYFSDEGLDVEFRFFQAAQPMAVAIASGDADYAVTAITGGLISLAEKGAALVIGGALSEEKGIDGQMILASNAAYEAGLTSPAALDGKSFAITQAGSSFHYMGAKIAEAEGVNVSYKPLQKVGAIIGALKSGQVDAWTIVPHIGKALVNSGAVQVIGQVADYIPDYQVTTVFTSAQNANHDAAKTKAFMSAFSRGADDFNAALVDKTAGDEAAEEMIKLIHKYVYADQPYEQAAPSIRNGAMRINKDGALNIDSVGDQLKWFRDEGLVGPLVTPDTIIKPGYAPHI